MGVSDSVLTELIRRIRMVIEPQRVILFGSAARGTLSADSDLDVLVVVRPDAPKRKTSQAIYRQMIGFDWAVDVVVATEDDLRQFGSNCSLVYYPALREGKLVYGQ